MNKGKYAKPIFALIVVALMISIGFLSYIYLDSGQEAFTGTPDNPEPGDTSPPPTTVSLAPDFSYPSATGGTVSLSALRGKVVVLDFMATWCGPCKEQISNLVAIRSEYSSQDVVFISIDVDTSETSAELLAFRNDLGATWDFVLDANAVSANPKYDTTSIPTMVFVSRDGSISQRDVGLMSVSKLRAAIDPLV